MGFNQENEYNKQEQNYAIEFAEKDITNSSLYTNLSITLKKILKNSLIQTMGQQEENTIEESICRPLIGRQNHKPYFYYCKEHPKVENINLISIEN